jgi:sodium transport system permease protein
VGLWFRHLRRDREDLPNVSEALFCAALILLVRFFFSLVAPPPSTWNVMAATTLTLLLMVAAPACLMAVMLTRRPAKSLLLCRPSFWATVPAAGLLAVTLHPVLLWFNEGIRQLYPVSPSALAKLQEIDAMFRAAPLWQALAVIALAPAICEELAFRGFILSGLRRMGHKWGAILLTSAIFGLAHGILQQSIGAAAIGVVIGYVAVKTGSLLPGVLYHAVHNGLSVSLGRLTPELVNSQPWLKLFFEPGTEADGLMYRWPVTAIAACLAIGIIWWLKRLPYQLSTEERLQEAMEQAEGEVAVAHREGHSLGPSESGLVPAIKL